jgi:calcium-independent phospholipase A2-gamma
MDQMSSTYVSSSVEQAGESALNRRGLRILCFDGGGVRGKASLLILREIMKSVGDGARPCDFFDFISGTSTGGLIAIMLAKLGYSIEQAIGCYDELAPKMFAKVAREVRYIINGGPLIDEGPLEEVFRMLGRVDGRNDALMDDGSNPRCKVNSVMTIR